MQATSDSASLDTQAIDVVEIVESDPDSRVLEEHVAEQEWTREFVIDDEQADAAAQPEADAAHADAQASAEVGRRPQPPTMPTRRLSRRPKPRRSRASSRCRW